MKLICFSYLRNEGILSMITKRNLKPGCNRTGKNIIKISLYNTHMIQLNVIRICPIFIKVTQMDLWHY